MASQPVTVRLYRFRNKLKEKTAGLGREEDVKISPDALARAEAALAEMAEDYPDWVRGLIGDLSASYQKCLDQPEGRSAWFAEIRDIARDMKGQGGTFGYPLITSFADSLYGFSNMSRDIKDSHLELIKAHIDAMRAVIFERVSGDGGKIGRQLERGLERAIEKFRVRRER